MDPKYDTKINSGKVKEGKEGLEEDKINPGEVIFSTEGAGELIPAAGEDDEEEESEFDIEAIKAQYRRSGTMVKGGPGKQGYVKRDISIVRREKNDEPPLRLWRKGERPPEGKFIFFP